MKTDKIVIGLLFVVMCLSLLVAYQSYRSLENTKELFRQTSGRLWDVYVANDKSCPEALQDPVLEGILESKSECRNTAIRSLCGMLSPPGSDPYPSENVRIYVVNNNDSTITVIVPTMNGNFTEIVDNISNSTWLQSGEDYGTIMFTGFDTPEWGFIKDGGMYWCNLETIKYIEERCDYDTTRNGKGD